MQEGKTYSLCKKEISYHAGMEGIDPRQLIRTRITEIREADKAAGRPHSVSFSKISKEMGRNSAYLHQYVTGRSPVALPEQDRAFVARRLGLEERLLKEKDGEVGRRGINFHHTEGEPEPCADSDEFTVLLQGSKIKINATVDLSGIAKLKQVLDKYEEILKLMT